MDNYRATAPRSSESDRQTKKNCHREKLPDPINIIRYHSSWPKGEMFRWKHVRENNYKIAIYRARGRVVAKEKRTGITAGTGMVIDFNANPKASYY